MQKTTGGVSVADSLRDARVALRSAWYDAALELLDGCEDWDAPLAEEGIVLKAQTILRRDPVGAVTYLTTVADIPASPAGRFAFALTSGHAYAAVRDWSSAESRYAEAAALTGSDPHGAALLAMHRVRLKYFRRQVEPESPDFALALTHPDATVQALAYSFRAWFHAWSGRWDLHIADLQRVVKFATTPSAEPADVATIASAAHSLAQSSFERANEAGIVSAREAVEALPWTPDIQFVHFAAVRALGWDAFLRGRSGEAQWTFKDARNLAPATEFKVMAHLDRAYVARIAGNEVWAIEELAEADRLAHDVRWESKFDESRQALVMLATLYAPVDAVRAQRYAALYSQLGLENINPLYAIGHDPRGVGFRKYAQGKIDQTMGRKDAAVASLTEAYEVFAKIGFHYRASLTASALAELTAQERWRETAIGHARQYPDCPLGAIVEKAIGREEAMPADLTPLQRQIARALWSGVDAPELSKRFSRSLYTIEREINAVFAAFGVASRGALLEEARHRALA